MSQEEAIYQFLQRHNIAYRLYRHEAMATMEDAAKLDQRLGVASVKALFVEEKEGGPYGLILLPGQMRFNWKTARRQDLPARRFGAAAALFSILKETPGAVSPLGLVFDSQQQVTFFAVLVLREIPYFAFHPCICTATVVISGDDFFGCFLPALGRKTQWFSLSQK